MTLDVLKSLGLDFLSGKDPDEFTLKVNNVEIPVLSAKVFRSFDTCADTWTASVAWAIDEENFENDVIYKPLIMNSYYDASVYIGGELVITGRVYEVKNKVTYDDATKELEGYSYTIDVVDSSPFPPYEFKKQTLEKIAKSLLTGYDIKLVIDPSAILNDRPFKKVTCKGRDKIFSFLSKLAKQRDLIISSTVYGELLITTANVFQKPVGTIEDGKHPGFEYNIGFNGRKLFKYYKTVARSPGRRKKIKRKFKSEIAIDNNVPGDRRTVVRMDESDIGELKNPIEWYRSKQLIEALTLEFPVIGWYAPNGELWKPNTLVTIRSVYLELPRGYTFFIRAVTYNYSIDGNTAILHLTPKESFTGGEPKNPWADNSSVNSTSLIDRILDD